MNWREYRRWRHKEDELNKQIYRMAKELQGPEKVGNEYGPGYRTLKNYERPNIYDCLDQARDHYANEIGSIKADEPSQAEQEELEFELREHERSFSQRLHKAQEEKDLTQRLGQLKELSKELSDEMWEEAEVYTQEEGISIPRAFERIYGANLFSLRAMDMQLRSDIEETENRLNRGQYHEDSPYLRLYSNAAANELNRRANEMVRSNPDISFADACQKILDSDERLKHDYATQRFGYVE